MCWVYTGMWLFGDIMTTYHIEKIYAILRLIKNLKKFSLATNFAEVKKFLFF